MKAPQSIPGFALMMTLMLISNSSWAQATKELDITLSIVDEQDSPETIINRIPLPPPSAVIPGEDSVVTNSSSNVLATPGEDATETLHNQIENTANQVLDTTSDVLTNTLNDTISTGDLESLPGDIIDKLPDELPDDLLPPVDDIVDDLTGTAEDALPNVEESLDSAIDDLENTTEIPENIEQIVPVPEPGLPETIPESLPTPVDDLTEPLNP